MSRRQVAVVTGGGGGIGAAIAEELGRRGLFVCTVDPLVSLDGSERLPQPEQTTAGRIVAAGGAARASATSVTDGEGLAALFAELASEHGGLDVVVNAAGITRQTSFASGSEEDWRAVLDVHLGGYLNVLGAALPHMAAAGHGRVLGVTSGSGWRAADVGAYSCAKRAVAALTWQLGRHAPPGVTVNAISPIAATRMVAAALERARQAGRTGGGGVSFLGMPPPEHLAPFGAHLVGDDFGWCTGQVLFAGGSEVAVIDRPRLLEAVRTDRVASLARVLEDVLPRAFAPAEAAQATDGGGNPRFGPIFDEPSPGAAGASPGAPGRASRGAPDRASPGAGAARPVRSCALVADHPELAAALTAALAARGVAVHRVDAAVGFEGTAAALRGVAGRAGGIDAVVVAVDFVRPSSPAGQVEAAVPAQTAAPKRDWRRILLEHDRVVEGIRTDAAWARAASDHAAGTARPLRLVTLTDGRTSGGRSRAQAAAQLARAAVGATQGRVTAFAVGVEAPPSATARATAELASYLVAHPDAGHLAGAELVVGPGYLGLRSHPRPLGSLTFGGPEVPSWLDQVLADITDRCSDVLDGLGGESTLL